MRAVTAGGALALTAWLAGAAPLAAQIERRQVIRLDTMRQRRDTLPPDSLRDTIRAGRSLPRQPSRTFPEPDSIIRSLLTSEGFRVTRFKADSMRLFAQEKEIRLAGEGLVEREGASLEADSIRYVEGECALFAVGSPRLYDPSGVLFGREMTYDACNRTGIVGTARTDFQQGNATWFLNGNLAFDNVEDHTFGSGTTITSCELEDPHYHFAAREVKYVSKRLMVSRPAVLYVQDVPVLWLPFIFQDMKRGRRSGLIPPQFGLNDIVRNSPQYQRHVASLGYYWAMSEYTDAQITVDWYAQRFVAFNGRVRYRWLDRFLAGGFALQELYESGGSSSRRVSWSHQQQFNINTQLTASLDYASSSRVVSRNAVDPVLAVATIDSRLNFQRRFTWGQLNVGGSRTQSLDRPQVSMTFPSLSFTPNPIALSRSVTWSPAFNVTNQLQMNVGPGAPVFPGPGLVDSLLSDSRATSIGISTPLRIGRWTWSNSISITDNWNSRRERIELPDPTDSTRKLIRTYGENAETGLDWQTGFGLPVLLQGTWNLQPGVSFVNTTGGSYLIRNRFTGGRFVSQGKRVQLGAALSPTFFGLFGGVGPVARMRHSLSPTLSWSYAPSADVPEEYARALNRGQLPATLRSQARQTVSIGLSQILEAKLRPDPLPPGADTTATSAQPREGRKLKLISIQSDPVSFDLEQARQPGRTAWATDQWGNTVSSDLLRGFSVRLGHDLFEGPVGFVGSKFKPALTSVAMGFSLGAGTLRGIGSVLGLTAASAPAADTASSDTLPGRSPTEAGRNFTNAFQRGPLATRATAVDRLAPGRGTPFQTTISYSLQRTRPDPVEGGATAPASENQMLSGSVSFSPTRHWSASWSTSYNVTRGEFSDHVVRLDRNLHDWRATFTFVKSPNGNFLFNFSIQLIDQQELHFDYDQRNIFR